MNNFLDPITNEEEASQSATLEFYTTIRRINFTPGSSSSVDWLKRIFDANNREVFRSNLVLLIDYKWEQVKHLVYYHGLIYIVYAILLILDAH